MKKTALFIGLALSLAGFLALAHAAGEKDKHDCRGANKSDCAGKCESAKLEEIKLTLFRPEGDSAYLLHLVAQENGYFTEQGCKLTARHAKHHKDYEGMKDGKLPESDLYLMGRSAVYITEAANPGLIKAFNFNVQTEKSGNDAILVKDSLGITDLKQLPKGQTVGILGAGPAGLPFMKMMLDKSKLNPADFTITNLNNNIKAISETGISIAYVREPFLSLLLAQGGWKILVDGPLFARNVFSPWPMTMTVFSSKFLKEKPALAQKVVSAYEKAISFVRQNPKEAESIMTKYMEKTYGAKDLKIRTVDYLSQGEITKEAVQKQMDWYYEQKIISHQIKAEDILCPPPAVIPQ